MASWEMRPIRPGRGSSLQRGRNPTLRGRNFLQALASGARYAYGVAVVFEWDPAKSEANAQARGISFARAAAIFAGRLLEWHDDRRPYGETRIRALGETAGVVLHVVYTRRGAAVRIISARRANRQERARWNSSA
jgi:uncharacterized DUF497 family protein